jgi:hypothetical protein
MILEQINPPHIGRQHIDRTVPRGPHAMRAAAAGPAGRNF